MVGHVYFFHHITATSFNYLYYFIGNFLSALLSFVRLWVPPQIIFSGRSSLRLALTNDLVVMVLLPEMLVSMSWYSSVGC